jgi:predicted GH43/DUF377 family glycosyl hydrolase
MIVFWINVLALLLSVFVAGCILGAVFSRQFRATLVRTIERIRQFPTGPRLRKLWQNPIMRPGTHAWQGEAVLNPAAIQLAGRTHLVYRAVGTDGVSRLGYASSADGIFFDDHLPYPVYVARDLRKMPNGSRRYSPVQYPSGGSWGGCEDPRMVLLEGRIYLTYNAFDGWARMHVAFTSIAEEDFINKRFYKWAPPKLLSPPTRNKNWLLFPEKMGGKFAILHSINAHDCDHVLVEYVDDIETVDTSKYDFWSPDPQRLPNVECAWHLHMRSAGPPPIRTSKGWLVFYHAHDTEGDRYKLGALLLDLDDPTRVIARAAQPVLTPDAPYENDGKPGIIYACGAVVRDGVLYIYYGGADKVVCVATTLLEPFVDTLLTGGEPAFTTEQSAQTE